MSTSAQEWDRAEAAVAAAGDTITKAPDHRALRAWAEEHDLTGKSLWLKVKSEMRKQHDVDYDEVRAASLERDQKALTDGAAQARSLTLCIAGDAEEGAYAICPPHSEREAWYGTYHASDRTYKGDDFSAEVSAAQKAIFLARKLREKLDEDVIALTIRTSHPDLAADHLSAEAIAGRVAVTVEHVEQNPAIALTRVPGYSSWRDVRLQNLLPAAQE